MPSTKPQTVRGPIRRPGYAVVLELPDLAERVECPWCAAGAGAPCSIRATDGSLVAIEPHDDRLRAVRRHYLLEASSLDDLADIIEREIRVVHPNRHVGVRLDPAGEVLVRLGWTSSQYAGTWKREP